MRTYEYTYLDNGVIKSKVIANEDAYPVYDDNFNYVAFVEHWEDFTTGHSNYIVYTPTLVQHYIDNALVKEDNNLSGLPIHYAMMDKTEYNSPYTVDVSSEMQRIEAEKGSTTNITE